MRLRVNRRRRGFSLAPAPWVRGDACGSQRFDHFTAQGLELRVGDEERLRRIQLDAGGMVFGGAELAQQVAQGVQRLFRLVGHAKRAGQGDTGADAFFAGRGDLQLLFTQARDP